jgi:hypothetical protein
VLFKLLDQQFKVPKNSNAKSLTRHINCMSREQRCLSVSSCEMTSCWTKMKIDICAGDWSVYWWKSFLSFAGSLKLVYVLLTVLGILIPIASIIYCFWTTRRSTTSLEQAQRRLADNDNNLLNQSLQDLDALVSMMWRWKLIGCDNSLKIEVVGLSGKFRRIY